MLGLLIVLSAVLAALAGVEVRARGKDGRTVYGVSFAPRGGRVAAVGEGGDAGSGRLWVWDAATGRRVAAVPVPGRPVSLAFAPDGSALAVGEWDGAVRLRDPSTGRVLRTFSGHSTPVRGLAFLPDGRTLAAGASDGRVVLWDVATGRESSRFDRGLRYPVNGMAVSADGRYLAAAGGLGAGAVSLWDLGSGRPVSPPLNAAGGEPVAFVPGRAVLAARGKSLASGVDLIDLASGRALTVVPAAWVRGLAVSPDGRFVAAGGDEGFATVWEAATGRRVAGFAGHRYRPGPWDRLREAAADFGLGRHRFENVVWSVAFSPDGARLASAGQDGAVWLWEVPPNRGPGRALLPRANPGVWRSAAGAAAGFAALALLAVAVGGRGRRRPEAGGRVRPAQGRFG